MKKMKNINKVFFLALFFIAIGSIIGLIFIVNRQPIIADNLKLDDQEATVRAIKKVSQAVVSIDVYGSQEIVYLNLGASEQKNKIEKKKVGSGTGFLISADGLIITNKHVISASNASQGEYRITLNSGKKYYAQLIGKDPLNDLAILKIFDKKLPFVELADSGKIQPGLTVIAIGNALGLYQNSATKGIVSGLNRDIVASDQSGNAESLGNVIQTDAEINLGNSGGPLIDLNGKVVGVNVAVDAAGSSIGFAIPINDALPVIKSARENGRIVRPRLGIRYSMITPELAAEKKLSSDTGAWVNGDESNNPAITPDSPAARAGIRSGDIILEVDGIKLEGRNTLLSISQRHKPGDKIGLKILRDNKKSVLIVQLDEFKIPN